MSLTTLIQNWLRRPAQTPCEPSSSRADYMRLEERIVYSAAPLGELGDVEIGADPQQAELEADWDVGNIESPWGLADQVSAEDLSSFADAADPVDLQQLHLSVPNELKHELVFVDTQTDNYEQLVDDLRIDRPNTIIDVVLLHSDTDGVEQISRTLDDYHDLDAIHFVSHGEGGNVQLGGTQLDLASLSGYASELAGWGNALQPNGDLLFYGCDLAASESGVELLESIGELTEADVAASDDITGHSSLGGDWQLEYEHGTVESDVAFSFTVQASWIGDLNLATIDETLVNSDPALDVNDTQSTTRSNGLRNAGSAVAVSPSTGNHVVVWTETTIATGDEDVYFQLFDWAGRTVGNATRVHDTTAGDQDDAAVAMDADGNFIVVWESTELAPAGNDIMARRFDANGTPLAGAAGDVFRVHTDATGEQHNPDVDMNDAGQFVVGWEQRDLTPAEGFIKIFDADGSATSAAIQVNQGMATEDAAIGGVTVGMDGAGNVVAAWDELDTINVEIRKFDNAGNALPNEQVLPNTIGIDLGFGLVFLNVDAETPDIDVREDGHVAVSATARAGSFGKGPLVLTFLPDLSNAISIDLLDATVNDSGAGDQINSSIVYYDNGELLVTWEGPSDASDVNDTQGVYGKRVLSTYNGGTNETTIQDIPGQSEFTINQTTNGIQRFVSVASRDPDNAVIVWSGEGPGDGDGVFMRQFGTQNAPVAEDDDLTVSENGTITFDPLDNDWDPNGDPLTLASVSFGGILGQATLNPDDTVTFSPNGDFDDLLPGQSALQQFDYSITDGAETVEGTVSLTITGVNSTPASQVSSGITASPGNATPISATELNTLDADHVDSAEITYTLVTAPSTANGSLLLNGGQLSAGMTFTQQDVDNGLVTYEKTVGNAANDQVTLVATDPLGASTGNITFSLASSPLHSISGTVYEDINGDSDLADGVGFQSAQVSLYRDNGDGLLDSADTWLADTTTDASGNYTFNAGDGDYFVTVASQSLEPTQAIKYNAGFDGGDVWAVQTFGSEGALVTDGAGGVVELGAGGGAAYGGREAGRSDVSAVEITDKQHVTRVQIANADVGGVEYGFSFNVVTNTLAGDTLDHAGDDRTVQGSLRQFIQNANAIHDSNAMRFTPVVSANAGTWWQVDVSEMLPTILDNGTTIDGTAYSLLDGQTALSTNTNLVGNTGKVGTGLDGVRDTGDDVFLDGVSGPELEIRADLADNINFGLQVLADNTVIQHLAIHGFGDENSLVDGNISVGDGGFVADNTQIRQVVVGATPDATAADLANAVGANSHGIYFANAQVGVVQNTVVVGSGRAGIKFETANNIIVVNNELRNNGWKNSAYDGIDSGDDVHTLEFRNNLIADNRGGGIDLFQATGNIQIEGNTLTGNGQGGSTEGFGIRIYGSDNVITHNIIEDNSQDGIVVVGDQPGPGSPANRNQITQNSFQNNGGLAIDLVQGTNDPDLGDGVDSIDGFDTVSGNDSIDRPQLTAAISDGSGINISFVAGWGSETPTIQFYLASTPDSSDMVGAEQFGEGLTYIGDATFDGTNYIFSPPYAFAANDRITAIAIDSQGNTSEFSNVMDVDFQPDADDDTFSILEDTNLNSTVASNDADPDGDLLSYALVAPVANVTLGTDGTLSYTAPQDFFGTLTFQYTATDPAGNSDTATVSIFVQSVNDEESIVSNELLQTPEGRVQVIPAALLETDDVDNNPDEVIYSINVDPAHGQLEFTDNLGVSITSFTQEDINLGRVVYSHNSSDTTDDSFEFTVDDSQGTASTGVFNIEIINSEEQLVLTADLTTDYGATTPLTAGELTTTDADDTNSQIVYTVTTSLQHGQLELTSAAGTPVLSFSQADLNNGIVRYVHFGTSTASDTIEFDVDDGQGDSTSDSIQVHVSAQPPQISTNSPLDAAEGTTTLISSSFLQSDDLDSTPSELLYSISLLPQHGQLELITDTGGAISSFTQDDIDNNLVVYRHNSSDTLADSFDYVVSDGSAGIPGTFTINILNAEEQLTENRTVFLGIGDEATLTPALLLTSDSDDGPAELVYTVTSATSNGQLFRVGTTGPVGSFTQQDIANGDIRYQHDGGSTTSDSLDFIVDDGQGSSTNGTINFSTVNSEQQILNNNPLSMNEGEIANIPQALLLTIDADNVPIERVYSVIGTPSHGQLELTTQPGVAVTTFTQQDINQGRLWYRHDSSDTTTDSFFFSVNDGFGPSSSDTFNIQIANREEQGVNNESLNINEGGARIITPAMLLATDPDDTAAQLTYTVTSGPSHGTLGLVADGTPVTSFTQQQINDGLIGYQHHGGEQPTDSFAFHVDDGQGSVLASVFNIAVSPTNDAPTITVPGTQEVTEATPLFLSLANGNRIELGDVDVGNGELELTLFSSDGRMTLAEDDNLTFVQGNGKNDFTTVVRGTLEDLQAALDGLRFRPVQTIGLAEIDITLNDLGNTGAPGALQVTETIELEVFDRPDARNDKFQLIAGQGGIEIPIADNDYVPDGTLSTYEQPTNGKLTLVADGSLVYTPYDPTFVGTDTFVYQLTNGTAVDQARVEIVIAPAAVVDTPSGDSSSTSQPETPTAPEDELAPPPTQPDASEPDDDDKVNPGPASDSTLEASEDRPGAEPIGTGFLTTTFTDEAKTTRIIALTRYDTTEARTIDRATEPSFETGAYELLSPLGQFDIFVGNYNGRQAAEGDIDLFSVDTGAWQVPTGLVLSGGLSVGWVAWSLNSGYLLGSLLSTISPWTLVDPLPVLDSFGGNTPPKKKDEDENEVNETKDKLDEMID